MQRTHKRHHTKAFKQLVCFSVAALTSVFFGGTVMAAALPAPFMATYDVHHSGARVGVTTTTLSKDAKSPDGTTDADSAYTLSSISHPKGLAKFIRSRPVEEYSRFRWTAQDSMQPLSYTFKDGSRKGTRNNDIEFDWTRNLATSHYKGKDVDLELTEAVIDRLSLQVILMRDLMNDNLKESYKIANKNEIKTYEIEVLGEEVLDTDAGRFNTIKILQGREGSSRFTHLWVSKDHQYALVQLTQFKDNKPQTVLTLNRIEIETALSVSPDPEAVSHTPAGGSD